MTILLVRHAESAGNADEKLHDEMADHTLHLTDKGHQQARDLGIFLKEWYTKNPPKKNIRLWSSPYKRTMLTLKEMKDSLIDHGGGWVWDKCGRGQDIHFDDRLRERHWGLYRPADYKKGGLVEKENPRLYRVYSHIRHSDMGKYLARPYHGESLEDVSNRLRSFFHDLYFDIDHGIKDHLIVTHGAAMLAFVYSFTKQHPFFMQNEEGIGNTGVRLLDIDPETNRYQDYGVIYDPAQNIYLLDKPEKPVMRDLAKILG